MDFLRHDCYRKYARAKAFRDTAVTRKRRIEIMLSLPLRPLDRLAIQKQVKDIGRA